VRIDDDLRRECATQVRQLESGLVAVERSPDPERVDDLFRVAHSLKSNCGMAGLDGGEDLAHAVEDLLSDVRAGRIVPEGRVVDVALDAVDDIAALLDGEDPGIDPASRTDDLRSALERASERSGTDDPGGRSSVDPASLTLPPADPDEDLSVEEALERASQFDDLDSLAASIDDASEFAGLRGGGSFADLGVDWDADDSLEADSAVDRSGQESIFDRLKAEVEQEDADSLQQALEDVRFGQFDDDDDVTIQELIDLAPAAADDRPDVEDDEWSPTLGTAADDRPDVEDDEWSPTLGTAADDGDSDDPVPGAATDDVSTESGGDPFSGEGTDAFPDADADAVTDADASDAVTDDAAPGKSGEGDAHGGTDDAEPPDVADDRSPSAFESIKDEVESGDIEQLESDLEEVRFGEFDDEDDVSIQDLIDGTVEDSAFAADASTDEAAVPGAVDAEVTDARGVPDADAVDAVDADPDAKDRESVAAGDGAEVADVADADSTPVADAEPGEPLAADASAEPTADADDAPVEETTDETPEGGMGEMEWSTPQEPPSESDAFPAADDPTDRGTSSVTDDPSTDELPTEDSLTGELPTEDSSTEPPVADLPDVFSEEGIDVPDVLREETSEPLSDAASPAETELPDLDVVSPPATSEEDASVDAADFASEVGFERDAGTVAFESRFADLLGGDGDVRDSVDDRPRTALTIADSTLDDDQYQPSDGTTPRRGRPGRTDELQSISVDVETADRLLNLVEELSMLRLDLEDAVGHDPDPPVEESLIDLQGFLGEFRRTVMDVRLVPLRSAVEGLSRVVRDVSQEGDKRVALETQGTEVKLDRSIIDRLRDPLVHLVRNAVDHGIEPPADREAAGKSPEGRITIRAERDRDRIEITVSDDGRGIDPEEVREAAIDQGVLSPEEGRDMDRTSLFGLLFRPGFTTTTEVTSVSGRGVGMDVVDRVVTDLDGEVTVESTPGEGTTVTLRLPVRVAVTEVLFVESGEEQYGIPVTAVEQVSDPGPVVVEDGVEMLEREPLAGSATGESDGHEDAGRERYPLVRLAEAFAVPGDADPEGKVVWIRLGDEQLALHCDRVREAREVVVKPYEEFMARIPGVSGATMLGNGSVVNIIDVQSI
jgi:two-component system chemotaxis sensor kinase CheA